MSAMLAALIVELKCLVAAYLTSMIVVVFDVADCIYRCSFTVFVISFLLAFLLHCLSTLHRISTLSARNCICI